jgi:hypothetical protein
MYRRQDLRSHAGHTSHAHQACVTMRTVVDVSLDMGAWLYFLYQGNLKNQCANFAAILSSRTGLPRSCEEEVSIIGSGTWKQLRHTLYSVSAESDKKGIMI